MKIKELIHCFLFGVKHRQKYPPIVREFCLNIYYLSLRAYESIRSTFNNNLPHPSVIRSWYANCDLNCEPGISSSCLGILKKKAMLKKNMESELLVSVCFDEMYLRKHFQWCNKTNRMFGFPTFGSDTADEIVDNPADLNLDEAANQVIVFMAIGINENIKLPVAYHFINTLDAEKKMDLVGSVVDSLLRVGVIVVNIVFDGHSSNKRMCTLLGANLRLESDLFQPYFLAYNGHPVFILFDVPHMEKLIRNVLANHKYLSIANKNKIEWKFYVELVKLAKTEGFVLTHNMTLAHIEWKNRKMNVELAVQTFSKSTSDSMKFLMEQNHPKFKTADTTTKFTETFNDLFDIFNTKLKDTSNENIFKQPLSNKNKDAVFSYFSEAIKFINDLQIKNENGASVKVLNSRQNTGFKGFVINMHSLKKIYEKYVEQEKIVEFIPTYSLTQDPVEIFFGKNR